MALFRSIYFIVMPFDVELNISVELSSSQVPICGVLSKTFYLLMTEKVFIGLESKAFFQFNKLSYSP